MFRYRRWSGRRWSAGDAGDSGGSGRVDSNVHGDGELYKGGEDWEADGNVVVFQSPELDIVKLNFNSVTRWPLATFPILTKLYIKPFPIFLKLTALIVKGLKRLLIHKTWTFRKALWR